MKAPATREREAAARALELLARWATKQAQLDVEACARSEQAGHNLTAQRMDGRACGASDVALEAFRRARKIRSAK